MTDDAIRTFFRKYPRGLYVFSALATGCVLYSAYYAIRTHIAVEKAISQIQLEISEGLGG